MGRIRKEDLNRILDSILFQLNEGNEVDISLNVDDIDFSSLSKEEVETLLKKVNFIIEKISEKQTQILNSISDKGDLKNYRF